MGRLFEKRLLKVVGSKQQTGEENCLVGTSYTVEPSGYC